MKHTRFLLVAALIGSVSVVGSGEVHADTSNIVGWGHDNNGDTTPPAGTDHVAISAGEDYGLALKTDGSIVGWGYNNHGQATPPAGTDYVAIAAGAAHGLALKTDGSIVGWGLNDFGQATPPAGTDYVAIAAGYKHNLALKTDGSIVGWGYNISGQATPPAGTDYVAISTATYHSLALKTDGSIVGWGYNTSGQATPPAGTDYVAVAAGGFHGLALKKNGSIVGWGWDYHGQATPPAGNDYVAIAAGVVHGLALKTDGSIVGWGSNEYGQTTPPVGTGYVAIAAVAFNSLAIINAPSAPADVVGVGGDGEVTVSWTAPVPRRGSPITAYTATASPGGQTCTTTSALSCTVTGLENWTDYVFSVTATNSFGTGPPSTPSKAVMPYPSAIGEFTTVTPARVLDTRTGVGTGGVIGPVGPNSTIDVQITGQGGVPTTGVQAVVMNVTAVDPTGVTTFLTVYPTGIGLPNISNINTTVGNNRPNLVTVAVGDGGKVTIYNYAGSTHMLVDVAGFYADDAGIDGSRFRAVDPVRIADTRHGIGGIGTTPLGPAETRTIRATGHGDVPITGPTAVVLNVTIDAATATSFLTVSPADVARPIASNLNYTAGATAANQVIVRVPADGMIDIYNDAGTATVIVDLVGYYETAGSDYAGRFISINPYRHIDTRVDDLFPPPGYLWDGDNIWISWDEDPYSAAALNVTVTDTTIGGYITTYPYPGDPPNTSTVNYGHGDTVANHAIVRCGPDIGFINTRGTTHLLVDVFGVFT